MTGLIAAARWVGAPAAAAEAERGASSWKRNGPGGFEPEVTQHRFDLSGLTAPPPARSIVICTPSHDASSPCIRVKA